MKCFRIFMALTKKPCKQHSQFPYSPIFIFVGR